MAKGNLPRNGVTSPFEGFPAIGAVHDVIPTDSLRNFQFDFSRISDLMLKQCIEFGNPTPMTKDDFCNPNCFQDAHQNLEDYGDWPDFDPRHYYKIFDVETLGVSVVEMDASARAARAVGAIWEKQDFGAVQQEAINEVAKQTGIFKPKLKLNNVMGVGRKFPGVDKKEVRQKLALLPDTTYHPETTDLLESEAEIINSAIRRRLKHFLSPWDVVPHVTFAIFRQKTSSEAIKAIEESTKNYLQLYPIAIRLGELTFRHKSIRGRNVR